MAGFPFRRSIEITQDATRPQNKITSFHKWLVTNGSYLTCSALTQKKGINVRSSDHDFPSLRNFYFKKIFSKVTSPLVGDFFVPGPLGDLKRVPGDVFGHAELICTFFMKIFLESKNRIFSSGGGGGRGDRANFDQF